MKHIAKTLFFILVGHFFLLFGCNEPPVDLPLVSSFTPLEGELQTIITIEGTNFAPTPADNLVNINGFTCPVISASSTQLVIKAIRGISSGIVSVTIDKLSVVAPEEFVLIVHKLDSISATAGHIGDKVDFFGTKFPKPADDFDPYEDMKVTFNDQDADPITDYDYTTKLDTTTFSVLVPEGASTGKIYITIGSATIEYKDDFEVTP